MDEPACVCVCERVREVDAEARHIEPRKPCRIDQQQVTQAALVQRHYIEPLGIPLDVLCHVRDDSRMRHYSRRRDLSFKPSRRLRLGFPPCIQALSRATSTDWQAAVRLDDDDLFDQPEAARADRPDDVKSELTSAK